MRGLAHQATAAPLENIGHPARVTMTGDHHQPFPLLEWNTLRIPLLIQQALLSGELQVGTPVTLPIHALLLSSPRSPDLQGVMPGRDRIAVLHTPHRTAMSERLAYHEVPHLTAKLVSNDGAFDFEQEEDRGGL